MKKYWGYDQFRPLQKEIIESILTGKDTLAILPTGGGKSVCFQIPALAQQGICIVVSPLIALMKDQVENLKKRDIPALLIHSGMKRIDVVQTLKNASHDYFKFLYVSPERLETSLFNEYLPALNVNLIAVDEAHCISQWGYDFRPSYLKIAELRKELPDVPVLALTASATPEVQADIEQKLEFKSSNTFQQSFERKNLSYSVFKVDSKFAKLVDIVSKVQGCAIVYCKSRKRTNEIMNLLQMHGISSTNYHAGLKQEERNKRQKDWIENKVRVIVCTNAFGMGIDKPDVRLVVHADTPDCLENYYQEAGRGGRDGKKSYAVLLYDEKDIEELKGLHAIRFPTMEQIKNVYGALTNFLQIPAYTGEYKSFNFRFHEFIRNFKLNSNEALYSLKALESDGWLELNEKSFTPSTLVFTTSKRELAEFEKHYSQHEVLLTTLLRSYEGIFDFPAFISENLVARLLKKDEADITHQLQTIASFGIISYTPQNEEPQIVFKKNRVPVDDLMINLNFYNKRKDGFVRRIQTMINYTKELNCRSHFIGSYFGDEDAKVCGICDNCLRKKATNLSAEEFEKISILISNQLSQKKLTASELINEIRNIKKEKAWKVIEFLQAEKKIEADSKGLLRLK
ncbi:MAG TPA: ATP-dependent DNA helicase RecQ [Flavisolibacter sp.]|nr:ATP-dependent DNA helicase RecQ [Flavisolibacter sp.]